MPPLKIDQFELTKLPPANTILIGFDKLTESRFQENFAIAERARIQLLKIGQAIALALTELYYEVDKGKVGWNPAALFLY